MRFPNKRATSAANRRPARGSAPARTSTLVIPAATCTGPSLESCTTRGRGGGVNYGSAATTLAAPASPPAPAGRTATHPRATDTTMASLDEVEAPRPKTHSAGCGDAAADEPPAPEARSSCEARISSITASRWITVGMSLSTSTVASAASPTSDTGGPRETEARKSCSSRYFVTRGSCAAAAAAFDAQRAALEVSAGAATFAAAASLSYSSARRGSASPASAAPATSMLVPPRAPPPAAAPGAPVAQSVLNSLSTLPPERPLDAQLLPPVGAPLLAASAPLSKPPKTLLTPAVRRPAPAPRARLALAGSGSTAVIRRRAQRVIIGMDRHDTNFTCTRWRAFSALHNSTPCRWCSWSHPWSAKNREHWADSGSSASTDLTFRDRIAPALPSRAAVSGGRPPISYRVAATYATSAKS